jgi:hypothetical protein
MLGRSVKYHCDHFEQRETDNILIILSNLAIVILDSVNLGQIDHMNKLITLFVIT